MITKNPRLQVKIKVITTKGLLDRNNNCVMEIWWKKRHVTQFYSAQISENYDDMFYKERERERYIWRGERTNKPTWKYQTNLLVVCKVVLRTIILRVNIIRKH